MYSSQCTPYSRAGAAQRCTGLMWERLQINSYRQLFCFIVSTTHICTTRHSAPNVRSRPSYGTVCHCISLLFGPLPLSSVVMSILAIQLSGQFPEDYLSVRKPYFSPSPYRNYIFPSWDMPTCTVLFMYPFFIILATIEFILPF
jgi:hypothetical protein